jgi:hypothetical protein
MKRIATALGICSLLLALPVAYAGVYTWDGDTSSDWQTATNWAEAGYPGRDAAGDTATINADTSHDTVIVSTTIPHEVDWVLVDAEAAALDESVGNSVDLTLKIDTGGVLDVDDGSGTGYIRLIAGSHDYTVEEVTTTYPDDATLWVAAGTLDVNGTVTAQAAESVAADAEIQITGGTFTPDSMKFDGSQTSSYGHAIGDFDAGVTVQGSCDGTVDTCMEGHVDIELANSSTVDAKDLKIGDCGSSGNSGTVAVSGNGTLRACSFVMKGGSSVNSTLTVSDNASVETYDPS